MDKNDQNPKKTKSMIDEKNKPYLYLSYNNFARYKDNKPLLIKDWCPDLINFFQIIQ